jgi:hypothetical protein
MCEPRLPFRTGRLDWPQPRPRFFFSVLLGLTILSCPLLGLASGADHKGLWV